MPKTVYFVDNKILELFLGLEDEKEKEVAYGEYLSKVNVLVIQAVNNYFTETLDDKLAAAKAASDMVKQLFGSDTDGSNVEVSAEDIQMNQIMPKELKKKISDLVQQLNKFLYETYSKDLPEDRKTKINEYVVSVESKIKEDTENAKDLIETAGTIAQMEKSIEELDKEIVEIEGSTGSTDSNQQTSPNVNLTQPHSNN